MIRIIVNGRDLVLYSDTTMSMEFNSALFSSDSIDGDIVYDFDIPIKGNEIALEYSHSAYVSGYRKFGCQLLVDGIMIANGTLLVKKVDNDSLAVSIVCNPFPDDWRDRSIRDNDSEEIVVSTLSATHQTKWKQFLKSTLTDSRIKFGPVIAEDGYGDDNEDFGYYNGYSKGQVCNRVVFDANGNVVSESDEPFVRLFNETIYLKGDGNETYVERNQQCLLPQVRLGYILDNVIANAGYEYADRITGKSELDALHVVAVSPLDATGVQFDNLPTWYYLYATRGPRTSGYYSVAQPGYCNDNPQGLMWTGNSSQPKFRGVKIQASGWYHIHAEITVFTKLQGEVRFIVSKWSDQALNSPPTPYTGNTLLDASVGYYYLAYYKEGRRINLTYDNIVYIDSSFVGMPLSFAFWIDDTSRYNKLLFLGSDVAHRDSSEDPDTLLIESKGLDQISYANIYKNRFYIAKCLPDVSNGDFITASVQSLGLAFYIDSTQRKIELVPYRDIKNARVLDISEYVLKEETEMECPDDGLYVFRLSSQNDADIEEDNLLTSVDFFEDLPNPYMNIGKLCYVAEYNSYFKAEKTESEESNWRIEWVDQHANRQDCIIGGTGEEDVTESDMKTTTNGTAGDYTSPIPSVGGTLHSEVYNTDSKPGEDILLVCYRGLKRFGQSNCYYQDMVPVKSGEFSLCADGDGNLCDKYIKEWRQLVSLSPTLTYKLRLPVVRVVELLALLKPQQDAPQHQTRWLLVDGVRAMPKKITVQVANNERDALVEIEAAKPD